MDQKKAKLTNYEKTRIIGARALQVAMDAPAIKKFSEKELEELRYSPLKIAEIEFEEGLLPITVKQPLPKKRHVKIIKTEPKIIEDKEVIEKEIEEEKSIEEEGEIMELANPGDEESLDGIEEDESLAELK
jgi:DNA-directed RNA polymerase subunit K